MRQKNEIRKQIETKKPVPYNKLRKIKQTEPEKLISEAVLELLASQVL